jgi:hypothetical protein
MKTLIRNGFPRKTVTREMPGCFFHLVNDDTSKLDDFTIDGFVKFYLSNKESQAQ